ncbi:MAG: hypothetical protein J07HX64_01867 [halophilic archaeon J07HX64]|nr:MAG: hypothetical protein J07HX64_01867 [halophilic archaeon J07HX64]
MATEYLIANDIAAAWCASNRDEARDIVTDEMVANLGLAGRAGAVRDQLDALARLDVVDEPLVVSPNGVSQSMKTRTVEALGPDA